MTDFPGNSHKSKDKEERPEVESVVSGKVIRRKKPLLRKVVDTFVANDQESVGNHILFDVIVPAIKDTIADAVTQTVERTLFGEVRHGSRVRSATSGSFNHVSYNKASGGPLRIAPEPRSSKPKQLGTMDFDQIILATRSEGDEVIRRMFELTEEYGVASVADLYSAVGLSSDPTAQKWGWDDMRGSQVRRTRDGYLLVLPKPISLD